MRAWRRRAGAASVEGAAGADGASRVDGGSRVGASQMSVTGPAPSTPAAWPAPRPRPTPAARPARRPSGMYSAAPAMPDSYRPGAADAGGGTRTPTACGHEDLNLARLPVPPRPPAPDARV